MANVTRSQASTMLTALGWRTNTAARLTQAIKDFQRMWNLGAALSVDGIVGPKTRDAISARTGTPVKSGATMAQIRAAGNAAMQMCWGWGYSFD